MVTNSATDLQLLSRISGARLSFIWDSVIDIPMQMVKVTG
jgi:hypothetical protein